VIVQTKTNKINIKTKNKCKYYFSQGREPTATREILFNERSKNLRGADRVRSPLRIDVIAFDDRLT